MKLEEIIKKHLHSISEGSDEMNENYMFFSNLKQIHRQCEMLLNMDERLLDKIIQDGHDWADDHVSEAKNNMDQVFDFFMNKTKSEDGVEMNADMNSFSMNEEESINEGKNKPNNPKLWNQCLAWARARYDVCPSAYCNGAASKRYKSKGGTWRKDKK